MRSLLHRLRQFFSFRKTEKAKKKKGKKPARTPSRFKFSLKWLAIWRPPLRLIRWIISRIRIPAINSKLLRTSGGRRWLAFGLVVFIILPLSLTVDDNNNSNETLFEILGMLSFTAFLYIVFSWFFDQWRLIRQLKNENNDAELMLLKSQINPHFFFNTLNNLYGLTVEKSDKAPEVVLKISDMMRYTIYEGQKDKVPIEDELEYLETYIELHKIRYHKKVDIQFTHHIQGEGYRITPLLFVILLENAVKHGIENLTENAYAHLSLIAGNGKVLFAIENNFDPNEIKEGDGIGLHNLQRRLELLYPEKHTLLFDNEDNVYKVQLEIDLS